MFYFFQIPRDEIFEDLKDFDLDSDSDSFRGRAATISNGHVARLKTLRERQVIVLYVFLTPPLPSPESKWFGSMCGELTL